MSFVLDCSVALAWVFPDEQNDQVDSLAKRLLTETAVVPSIWPFEIANVLWVAYRQGRIAKAEIFSIREALLRLPLEIEPVKIEHILSAVLDVSIQHQLTVYDSSYLELSSRLSIPLATLDKKLRKAAMSEEIPLLL
jgi:predicted nucleic acid-binding protein